MTIYRLSSMALGVLCLLLAAVYVYALTQLI
jgi:hypothetical protein